MKITKKEADNDLNTERIYTNDYLNGEEEDLKFIKKFSFIHFNDVYNIESRVQEPVGGASRFVTAVQDILKSNPSTIVFFSGDAFNPSMLSIILKGRQMIDALNELNITAACIGNHDFDFGVDHLAELISLTNFPWLLSNVLDITTEKPLADGKLKHIIESNGLRIGIIALVEEEWICTLSTLDYDEIIYEPFVECGRRLAIELRNNDHCDLVIALTHMRMPNDEILAVQVPEIDIILGGHDHDYNVKNLDGKFILKSGSDFREFSLIDFNYNCLTKKSSVKQIDRIIVDSNIKENEKIKNLVDSYMVDLQKELDVTLGFLNTDLEGRFVKIRTEETNLGNFMCDIVLESVNADCVIINSGTFRSDQIHPKGEFKVRDLKAILPFLDTIIVLALTGKQIHEAIENGVSQYPKLDGRFLQVSGLTFAFDPSKKPGNRIDPDSIRIQKEEVKLDATYLVATKGFLKEGKDGFDMLKNCEVIIDEENGPQLINLVENHFKTIQQIKNNESHSHRTSIVSLAKRNKLIVELSKLKNLKFQNGHDAENNQMPPSKHHHVSFHSAAVFITRTLSEYHNAVLRALTHEQIIEIKESEEYKLKMQEFEIKSLSLHPVVDKRILRLKKE